MKKTILAVAFVFSAITTSAQFYASLSGGASLSANEQVIGSQRYVSTGTSSDIEGSYGEGFHGQLRVGYFFNEVVGLELATGYLHGNELNNNNIDYLETSIVDMHAKGRAFGASLAMVINVTKNVYTRVGLLTKIGGKTVTNTKFFLPDALTGGALGADVEADFTTDFKGKIPLGLIGAIGYKYSLTENLSLFAEIEYMNIKVTRNSSSLASYSGNFSSEQLTGILNTLGYSELSPLLSEDYDWSDSGAIAPYSSIGLNIGVTYTF